MRSKVRPPANTEPDEVKHFLMGWTGCFPNRLAILARADEAIE
jgi:hypothetical protein